MPVESHAEPNVITNDFIGFSANSNTGTLPLARVPGQDRNGTCGTPGTLNAWGFWPAMGQIANDTGGGRSPGCYGGIEVLLRYTVSPRAGSVPSAPINFDANLPIAALGGRVLQPIGRQLDVIIDCLQANCNGALNLLTRNRVLPAARKKRKAIRSLGKKRFSVKKGRRKVRVKLNKLGRKLARRKRTKVTLVATFKGRPTVTKKMTMRKARAKKRRRRARR
jgi:hypothetical protein